MKTFYAICLVLFALSGIGTGLGCGYTFKVSRSPLIEKEGIRRVYVAPVTNNTFKAGIENQVYNELVRTISASGKVILVRRKEEADAVLQGSVTVAQSVMSASTTADQLKPSGLGRGDQIVAADYVASLGCAFSLVRRETPPGKVATLWSAEFSRTKPYPASNQLGPLGTTSPLINESEFDRALNEMSRNMMHDVHESMLAMF